MRFVEPIWLVVGLVICLALWWRFRRFDRAQGRLLAVFISPRLAVSLTRSLSPGRCRTKRILFVLATAGLFIALARPQAGFRWEEAHRRGLEILFAVDTSRSMLAQDVKPDRLTRAKLAVEDMLGHLNGDGVGLVAFAGDAFLQCPITLDYDAFQETVNALDTSLIPRGGTDIAAAIHEAEQAFKARANSDQILILITDGEDLGAEGISAARSAAKEGVKIFTVGVGSTTGELIPVPSADGGTEFLKDDSGQFVKSRLDESVLKQIASATGGMYQPLGQQGQGLVTIYEQGLKSFTRHELSSRQHKVYLEQYQWPLLAALLLFLVDPLIGTRRRRPAEVVSNASRPKAFTSRSVRRPALGAAAMGFILVATPGVVRASPGSAEKAYHKGDYQEAVKDYSASAEKQPANAQLHFNVGAAAYKAGEFDSAQKAFERALKTEELPVQQSAYYNLGNSQYRLGQQSERAHPEATIKNWQSAVQSYDAALQIKPNDADAKFNRDLVKRKLEQLQQQQKQQQKQQQNSDQKNSKQQKQRPGDSQKSKDDQGSKSPSGEKQKQDQAKSDQQKSSGDNEQQKQQVGSKPASQDSTSKGGQAKPEEKPAEKADAGKTSKPTKPLDGNPEPNAKPEPQKPDDPANADEPHVPGQMTRQEAMRLLDSLKNDERKMAAAPLSRGGRTNNPSRPLKDW